MSAGLGAPAASRRGVAVPRPRRTRSVDYATAAWLSAIPCAVAALATGYLLGPPLGRAIALESGGYTFLGHWASWVHPEPTERARYVIAVCSVLLFAFATATAPRWLGSVPRRARAPLTIVAQLLLVGVVTGSLVAQAHFVFGPIYSFWLPISFKRTYFTPGTLVVGALLAAGLAVALRSGRLRLQAAAMLQGETRRLALVIGALVLVVTAVWMLHAVHTDAEVANARGATAYHLAFTMDETFAVLNGRTPLVDFSAQYASLWPFVVALPMLAFGKTVLVFTIAMCTITSVALLAIYGVLRRVTRSSLAALALYLPFLATSLFRIAGTLQSRSTNGSYYANFPLRYAAPFFLAWLVARRLQRGRDAAVEAWLLFVVAGLAVLNNGDFGIAALGATIAALLWTAPDTSRRALLRLAALAVAGLATALALVTMLTLIRAGSLPELWRLVDYARLYTVGNFSLLPIPGFFGVHLLVYLTYLAAIVIATVRMRRRARNRTLTGMLAWASVFGLGAGFYYVGRSHPAALIDQFSAWALALMLLTVVAVRELATPRCCRFAIGAVAVLFGFGVMSCSLAQTPTPWEQLQRLSAPVAQGERGPEPGALEPSADPQVARFVASLADGPDRSVYKPGAPVAILLTNGHRIADAYGVIDVSPYTGVESMETVQRVETAIRALRDAGGNTVILPDPLDESIYPVLARLGFEPMTAHGPRPYSRRAPPTPFEAPWPEGEGVSKWVDMRHLHPRALRAR